MTQTVDRHERAAGHPLAAAFVLSMVVHLMLFAGYRMMPADFFKDQGTLARLMSKIMVTARAEQKKLDVLKQLTNQRLFEEMLKKQKEEEQEMPLAFVEVDPAMASEPPKQPKYYSTHDTVASNPKASKTTDQPKVDGTETRMPRLFENPKPQPRPTPQPLQPFVPKPKEPEPSVASAPSKETKPAPDRTDAKPETKSEPAKPLETVADRTLEKTPDKPDLKDPGGETIGDLAMAKPRETEIPNKNQGTGAPITANPLITEPSPPRKRERPRTLEQAALQNPMLAGKMMAQDGGVNRRGHLSLDAKGSPFGAYDAAFIAAVQERWFQLLEKNAYMLDHRGRVVLDFRLRFDGRITDMSVPHNNVGELLGLLCQRAVNDPAPFARWPSDMRKMVGADYREVRFTFYYD